MANARSEAMATFVSHITIKCFLGKNGLFLQIDRHDVHRNLVDSTAPIARCSVVCFSEVQFLITPHGDWLLLMVVDPNVLTLFPKIWGHTNIAYGDPRYEPLAALRISQPSQHSCALPYDEGCLESTQSALPSGLVRDWRYG